MYFHRQLGYLSFRTLRYDYMYFSVCLQTQRARRMLSDKFSLHVYVLYQYLREILNKGILESNY